jgi:beta-lactamase regulating signal transducer with metallopeptidase domain
MSVLELLIKASVLLGLVAAVTRLARQRTSAAVRHGLWTLAIAGVLVLPLAAVTIPHGVLDLPILPAESTTPPVRLTLAPGAAAAEAAALTDRAGHANTAGPAAVESAWRLSWTAVALVVYLAGVVLLVARLVTDHIRARRLVARATALDASEWSTLAAECRDELGIDWPVRVLRTDDGAMPMAVGLRRPVVLLPEVSDEWTAERRRAVMLHELAHVARHDCLTQALASLAVAVYWIHPGIWWAARRLQLEREFACDDLVLAAGAPAREYAGHLLDIAYSLRAHRAPALAVTMARTSQLEGRLLALLDAARHRAGLGRPARLLAVIATLAVVLPLAAVSTSVRVSARTLPVFESVGGTEFETVDVDTAAAPAGTHHAVLQASATDASSLAGTWELQAGRTAGEVYLELRQGHSSSGHSIPLSSLEGLSRAQLDRAGSVVFALRRDAGTFNFTGSLRDGVGAGTYTFTPSATFAAELARRGVDQPTAQEQHELATHDVGLALVDELRTQGYPTPKVADLVRAGHHGVTADYVKAMGGLGYSVGTMDALVRLRDHGVTPDYVRGLTAAGLPKLPAEALVNARDHGVTPDFIQALASFGYTSLGIDALVNARDHGITPDFVQALRSHGYSTLTLDQLVKARDHGVSADYVTGMSTLGYSALPIEGLVNARDHGVSVEYVKSMAALGYTRLPIETLVNLRDHGVTADYVSGLKALGYDALPTSELVMLRDHGVTPERAKRANDRAGTRLPPEMLRSLADGGMR